MASPRLHTDTSPEAEAVENVVERLRKSGERFQNFITNSSEHIWCVEFDEPIPLDLPEMEQVDRILDHGVYIDANEAFAKAYGTTLDEIVGWRFERTVPRSLPTTVPTLLEVVRSGFRLTDLESTEKAADGTERVMLNNFIPTIECGKVVRVWGTAREVTQARKIEQDIKLRSVAMETMRDGCVIADARADDFPIVYANKRSSEITGYSNDELLGRNSRFLQGPDTSAERVAAIGKAIEEQTPFQGEVLNYRKNGDPFWNFLRLSPVFNEEGTLTHYVGVLSDVTERKRNEEERLDLTSRLINAQEEEKRHLARELHDDLTQRLATIAMQVGTVIEAVDSSANDAKEQMHQIHQELTDLAGATQELSRQLHPKILEELGLAKGIGAECRRLTKHARLEFDLELEDADEGLSPEGSLCLYRIFQESLSNISRHAQATRVSVELFSDENDVVLRVKDDGIGFDPDKVGSGSLGLVSMSERARFCGGSLDIKSSPEEGVTITAILPISTGETP